jgi:hypothetical protein
MKTHSQEKCYNIIAITSNQIAGSNLVGVAPLDGVAAKRVEGAEQQLPRRHLHLRLHRASVTGISISRKIQVL